MGRVVMKLEKIGFTDRSLSTSAEKLQKSVDKIQYAVKQTQDSTDIYGFNDGGCNRCIRGFMRLIDQEVDVLKRIFKEGESS
jgi:hypothetical protein